MRDKTIVPKLSRALSFSKFTDFHSLFLINNTVVCPPLNSSEQTAKKAHLTPELHFHLITEKSLLFDATDNDLQLLKKWFKFDVPFWGFYWPGSQGLARMILDHPEIVRDKVVLDLGCGLGAAAIAAAKSGARYVVANDIDKLALKSAELNAVLNGVCISEYCNENIIGATTTDYKNNSGDYEIGGVNNDTDIKTGSRYDIIFAGDIFYEEDFAKEVTKWLHFQKELGAEVFLGDPGRSSLPRNALKRIKTYDLAILQESESVEHFNDFTTTSIWKLL